MEKLISVVVPVYNVEKYLDKCIESIVNQSYHNLEIILVDDGSVDDSGRICDEWAERDDRIVVIHKKNAGVSQARNDGIFVANGEFVAFVDSDDWIDKDMYSKLMEKQLDQNYDIVFCGFKICLNQQKMLIHETSKEDFCKTMDISYLLRSPNYILQEGNTYVTDHNINCYTVRFLYKKELLKNILFDAELNYMEDVHFLVRLFINKQLKIGFINDCCYNYMVRSNSLSNGKISNLISRCNRFLEKIKDVLIGTEYEWLLNAEKFLCYYIAVGNKLKYKTNDNLKSINYLNTRGNYKAFKHLCNGKNSHIKAFLIHYNLLLLYKLAIKIKGE